MKKLQTKLFITFFVMSSVIISVMSCCFYKNIYIKISDNLRQARVEVLNHAGDTIDSMTNMLLFAISVGPFQRQFKTVLSEDMDKDEYEMLQFRKEVAELFSNYGDTYQNLNISYYPVLYGFNGFQYCGIDRFSFSTLASQEWINDVSKADGRVVWISTQKDPYVITSSKNIFTLARLIKTGSRLKPVGILTIMVDESSLYDTYASSLTEGTECFIVDGNSRIVSHADKSLLGSPWNSPLDLNSIKEQTAQTFYSVSKEDAQNLTTYRRLTSSGWWLVETIPMKILMDSSNDFKSTMMLAAFVCFLTSILFSFWISKHLSKPMAALARGMKQMSGGDFNLQLPQTTDDEMGILINGFNQMAVAINNLVNEIKEQEKLKKEAEIRFLQAQINPHFIYNTLNSIRCMTLMGQNENASATLIIIIRMMRNVLSSQKMYVTLDDELNILKDYMDIQKAVYYKELNIVFDISPNVRMSIVPKLILQPIVENSIFHGIVKNEVNGLIQVRGYKEGNLLHIIIIDNGYMDEQTYIKLKKRLKDSAEIQLQNGTHIGLANINQRLKQIYGIEYGLDLLDRNGTGTGIHIWLPNITSDMGSLNGVE